MYTFKTSNENIVFSAVYCDCCKHKWTATKYVNKDGKWIKTDFYKRFDTLDELKIMKKLKTDITFPKIIENHFRK